MTETMLFIFSFSSIFYLPGNAVVTMSWRLMYSAVVAFTLAGHCLQFAASTCPTSNTALKVSLFSGDTFTCVGLLCPHRGHGSQRHEEQTQNLRGLSRFPYCLLHQLYAKLPDLRYLGVITWHG